MGSQRPHPIHTPTTTRPASVSLHSIGHPRSETKPSPPLPLTCCQSTKKARTATPHQVREKAMAGVNSTSVVGLKPAAAVPQAAASSPAKRVQVAPKDRAAEGRRAALLGLAAVFAVTATTGSAKAGIIDEYLEKSKANKELNDKKRLATSGANFARAYTVEFGSCQFPYNFTGCQDLAKQKKVPFITDDLEIECEGKEKYKCGSNVFWKW
ncbi:hypothetical protein GQ55_3G050200 [Panicum hallii var. hallii]|uniref:Photosystem I reaction center subunit N, chloroplastic n=2 Tax=Panicum hallii TaxID=206008 RepID=A0A2T7E5V8_9POAL|nr:hypothetical protein GQ55_3G050200 [Panicum hallii var. hallii]